MPTVQTMACPPCGHAKFQRKIGNITIGPDSRETQITRFVRPFDATCDELGLSYAPGELQKRDLVDAFATFAYARFIDQVFQKHQQVFRLSHCRIYQFQTTSASGQFIFGLFITDDANNLIDFCHEAAQATRRRAVLLELIRALCTRGSVAKRFGH